MINFENVLILEISDLVDYNKRTHDIIVDKSIFDNFVENSLVYIHFVEDGEACVREYKMTGENDNDIFMEYICEYDD